MARYLFNPDEFINGMQSEPSVDENKIRVLIVNRSRLFASALAALFDSEPAFEVIGQVRCCADCCRSTAKTNPDVVICDLDSENKAGAWSLDRFRNCLPDIPIIVVSNDDHEQVVLGVVRLGVQGFVTNNVEPAKLFEAVHTVTRGGCYLEDNIQSKILGLFDGRHGKRNPYHCFLNERERRILQLMARGMTNKQIGSEICLSTSAVKYHNSSIFKKLGVTNRIEAIKAADKQSLLS